MTRVLQVVGGLRRAGTETWLTQVARRLSASSVHMDFLVHGDEQGDYEPELRALGCEVFHTPSPADLLAYCKAVDGIIAGGAYGVVHSHLQHFSGLTTWLAYRRGVPMRVVHSHLDVVPADASAARRAYTRVMETLVRRYATHLVGVSRPAAAALFGSHWETLPNTAVVSCGIDLAPFLTPAIPGLRESLGLRPDGIVLGHVGRFVDQKNHAQLVEIAAEVMRRDRTAQLLLVGEGPLRPAIEQRCEALGISGRTVFAGTRPDVAAILKSAVDLFLFPSRYEGLGLAIVEAQAAGVPCVISDVVPSEAVVLRELVSFERLGAAPAAWADRIEAALQRKSPRQDAGRLVEASAFHVAHSVRWLEHLYQGEPCEPQASHPAVPARLLTEQT